jgi:predicted phosphodiesterase
MSMTPDRVRQIKTDLTSNPRPTQREIAARHGISRSTVSDIATGRLHKDVPWPRRQPVKVKGEVKSLYDPTDARVQALEAEVLHLREELGLEKRRANANAKTQGLFKAMVETLQERVVSIKPLPSQRQAKTGRQIEEHLVMHLSDGHHDQIVKPEECGGLEHYNFGVSCCRAERYVDTVLRWTQTTLKSVYNFPALWVLAYGDHTSGEIHGHVPRSAFRNQFANCLAIGKLHALMYRDLAPYFERVNVVYVPGNHGRRSHKKDHHGAHDNWDYLIAELSRLYCRDLENVEFLIPDAFSVNLDINGVGFNVSHGDDVRGSLGIPYYGLQRRQRSLIALGHTHEGPRIRYFCCGHFHKPGSLGDMDGEMVVNGPWVATDAYSYNSFAGYTEPSQWLHGVNPRKGITWRMDVKLRDQDRERLGPQRYRIEV